MCPNEWTVWMYGLAAGMTCGLLIGWLAGRVRGWHIGWNDAIERICGR